MGKGGEWAGRINQGKIVTVKLKRSLGTKKGLNQYSAMFNIHSDTDAEEISENGKEQNIGERKYMRKAI